MQQGQIMLLEQINKPNDIKKIKPEDYTALAREIRRFLVMKVSKTGGHLASNLGVVELTMALHLCLNLPEDKIIWDVGHQSYVHKILTGRKEEFDSLRQYGGLSGFPKHRESETDAFNTGHATTSISAALGIASANDLKGEDHTICCVIGDGALTGGMAFEALNNAAQRKKNLIIILNDNDMSISPSVGGMQMYLSNIRACRPYNDVKDAVSWGLAHVPFVGKKIAVEIKKTKSSLKQLVVPGMFFEDMGITYLGPVNGHDIKGLIHIINEAKGLDKPVVIHVCTKKGAGYRPAKEDPAKFHGVGPFDPKTGKLLNEKKGPDYTSVAAGAVTRLGAENEEIAVVCAAMPDGTGMSAFAEKYPDRFFDVGIAEEHAVTFAAGLARGGIKPYVCIYSTFLQRAYDQILHDVCLQDLPVTFLIDRAGLVGNDGETHQGTFDLSYLRSIPNMNIIAPKNAFELEAAINFAASFNAPLAIRYPKGEAYEGLSEFSSPIVYAKSEYLYKEKDIALIAAGSMVETAGCVRKELKEAGHNVTLVNARFIKPVDEEMIKDTAAGHRLIVTLEENVLTGGFGMAVLNAVNNLDLKCRVLNIAIPNVYVEQGSRQRQLMETGLDTDSVLRKINEALENL